MQIIYFRDDMRTSEQSGHVPRDAVGVGGLVPRYGGDSIFDHDTLS